MLDFTDLSTVPAADLLAELSVMEPCSLTIAMLQMIDRSTLSGDEAISFLQVHARVAAWWASLEAELLVTAASSERLVEEYTLLVPDSDEVRTVRIEDAIREEVSAAMRWSPAAAQSRIEIARLLEGPLHRTKDALSLGDITTSHVAAMVEEIRRLPGFWRRTEEESRVFDEACAEFETVVLPTACRGTLSRTRSAARRAVLRIDADGARRRREAARCTRWVYVSHDVDGMSTVLARLTTEMAHAVMGVVDDAAHADLSAGLAIDERRADAFCALVLRPGSVSDAVGRSPIRAHVDLVIDLPTLLELDGGTADLRGCGPVSADVLRDLLADPDVTATFRRLVADPITGHLLDLGRTTYELPQRLRDYVSARDRHCRFPGCRRKASRCQIDHAVAWDDGGRTDIDNVGALCVRHHQLKTHADWRIIDSKPDGSCTWISPQGRHYPHEPEQVLMPPRVEAGVSPPDR